jgi:hypothetical protein
MKIPCFGVTQHFTDKVDWILDLLVSIQLPPLDDDIRTNHIYCSRYVELQVFMGFLGYQSGWGSQILLHVFEGLLCLLSPLELVLFLEELKERESPDVESRDELLKAAMHPINFCMSWRLSSGFILVIADTFSGFGSIPRWETIYPSNFPEGTPNVHFSRFNFILNFLRLSKVSARLEKSPSSS